MPYIYTIYMPTVASHTLTGLYLHAVNWQRKIKSGRSWTSQEVPHYFLYVIVVS